MLAVALSFNLGPTAVDANSTGAELFLDIRKVSTTQGKPTHNTHAFDDAKSVETNKDNLLQEKFDPDNRRSLLHANHAIAHLMYQGDMLLSKEQAQHFYPNKTNDLGNDNKREKRQTSHIGALFAINRWDPKCLFLTTSMILYLWKHGKSFEQL
uniref:Uncharacterized protein n=1 Tax=Ditylenchus dipsaci TaxID=166011 RepID=A0A915DAG2_9BILA